MTARWVGRSLARILTGLLAVGAVTVLPGPAVAATQPTSTGPVAQQLAERYAPVVVIRRFAELCDADGEPFVPMTVDAVLGNPEVALRQVGNGDPVIKWAPTARDLYGRGPGVYLDFPGDALRPGCVYASDSARYNAGGKSAVYAHISSQPDRPGFVALQYWLYWYYNDWNDKHESDWEFIQLLFRASSVEDALTKEPVSVGYAQHTGGEVSDWGSDKLELDGSHPVVYSSERSHASYVQPALFLGRGASEGFGCDNTQAPSTRLRPQVVLLPDTASGPDDRFAWLAFQGRWGERQPSPNDGPTGPTSKPRWSAAVDWQDDLRASSFVVPGGSAAAPAIIDTFCDVVSAGSVLFIEFLASPAKVLGVLTVLLAVLLFLLRRTSWRAVVPLPIVAPRRAGEIVRAATTLSRQRPMTYGLLGLLVVPVGLLAVLVSAVLTHLPFVGPATTVAEGGDPGGRVLISAVVAAAFLPFTIMLVGAAVAWLLAAQSRIPSKSVGSRPSDRDGVEPHRSDAPPRAIDAMAAAWRHLGALASSFVPAVVLIGLLSVTVIGLPVAAWLIVRYQFLAQVTMLEGTRGRRALARGSHLVRGRWLHTALISALTWVTVQTIGVLVGLLLLIAFTGLPLWSVSAVVIICQIGLMPLGAIILTLLYGDARAQRDASRQDQGLRVPAQA